MLRTAKNSLCAAAIGLYLTGASAAAEYTMKCGYLDGEQSMNHQVTLFLEKYIEAHSNGRIDVQAYPSGQLGTTFKQLLDGVQADAIECASTTTGGISSFFPEIQVLDIPYLISNEMEVNALLEDPFFTKDLPDAILERTKNIRLGFTTNSGRFRSIMTTTPVRDLSDMKGKKIRVAPIEMHVAMMEALGAVPVVVPWTETYSALSTGVVDGLNVGVMNIVEAKMDDVVKYAFLDEHVHLFAMFWISNHWYQSLPNDLKRVVDEAFRYASVVSRGYNLQREADANKEFIAKGGAITIPAPDVKKEFVNATSNIRSWYTERYGDGWLKKFESALTRAKTTLPESFQ